MLNFLALNQSLEMTGLTKYMITNQWCAKATLVNIPVAIIDEAGIPIMAITIINTGTNIKIDVNRPLRFLLIRIGIIESDSPIAKRLREPIRRLITNIPNPNKCST